MFPATPLSSNSSSCSQTGPEKLSDDYEELVSFSTNTIPACRKLLAESCLAVMVAHVKCDTLLVLYLYADVFDVQPYFQPHFHIA